MQKLIEKILWFSFHNAEVSTFLLLWITAPLFFLFCFQLWNRMSVPVHDVSKTFEDGESGKNTKSSGNSETEIHVNKNEANA